MKSEVEEIETLIGTVDPEVELLAVEGIEGGTLRVFIDHPDGVSLEVCQRVTAGLNPLRDRYALEVSSPGPKRPLTRPEHFARFEGRRVKVRTADEIEGRKSFSGTIMDSTADEVTVGCDELMVRIPFQSIEKANLIPVKKEKGASR